MQVDVTKLVMDPLSDQEIEAYLATDLWDGKAGAFGYQDGNDWVLFSMKTGQGRPPQRIEPTDYGESISSLCFSPDGRYLLFCSKRTPKR